MTRTKGEIAKAETDLEQQREELRDRVRQAYRMGGVGFFEFLLDARSFRDFSLRLVSLQRQTLDDEDLILKLRKKQAELAERQRELDRQQGIFSAQKDGLAEQGRRLTISLNEANRLVRDLQGQLTREQIARLFRMGGSGVRGRTIPLDACPVADPHVVHNNFGAPRGGGTRRHQGNDIMAPMNTPIIATVSGRITRISSGGLGGRAVYLFGRGHRVLLRAPFEHRSRGWAIRVGRPKDRRQRGHRECKRRTAASSLRDQARRRALDRPLSEPWRGSVESQTLSLFRPKALRPSGGCWRDLRATMTKSMANPHRRRIDKVLDPSYVDALDHETPVELRSKLRDAREEEDAVSYVRRNLHGKFAVLADELEARRGGRGTSHSVEALVAVLGSNGSHTRGARLGVALRAASVAGRRDAERVLTEADLAQLPSFSEEQIESLLSKVDEAEKELSAVRGRLHDVIDTLEDELTRRYKEGLEPPKPTR